MTRTRSTRPRLRLECLEDRATPATFTVNSTLDTLIDGDGKLSLREAIHKANGLAGADVIVVPAGVYRIAIDGDDNANFAGDFDIGDSVTIRGAGRGSTVIDGQRLDRVFDVRGQAPSSIRVVLEGQTIRNGEVINPFQIDNNGGGVRVGNADLVVRDCAVTGNRATRSGGGISNFDAQDTGNVAVVRTTVARNIAGGPGGGIAVFGSETGFTIKDSTIRRNAAGNGGGIACTDVVLTRCNVSGNSGSADGGGIHAVTVTLINSTLSGNASPSFGGGITAFSVALANSTVSGNTAGGQGGGLWVFFADLTNSTVSGNSAGDQGGGIWATREATLKKCTLSGNAAGTFGGGLAVTTGTGTLNRCTVSGNRAGNSGGGINADGLNLTRSTVSDNSAAFDGGGLAANAVALTNSTISGNTAGDQGGGVWAGGGSLLNCTVVDNNAQQGGGLFHEPGLAFFVRNTIVALNLVTLVGTDTDVSGAFASQGHNLIGDGSGGTGFIHGVGGDIVGDFTNPIDPKLGPLANNGGPTKTHKLLTGSLAIDAGDNVNQPPTDQRGLPRRKDGNGDGRAVVDIGAFER